MRYYNKELKLIKKVLLNRLELAYIDDGEVDEEELLTAPPGYFQLAKNTGF